MMGMGVCYQYVLCVFAVIKSFSFVCGQIFLSNLLEQIACEEWARIINTMYISLANSNRWSQTKSKWWTYTRCSRRCSDVDTQNSWLCRRVRICRITYIFEGTEVILISTIVSLFTLHFKSKIRFYGTIEIFDHSQSEINVSYLTNACSIR